jgi:hypothetical protein
MFFLGLPIHDIFLSLMDSRYKVIEHWGDGQVRVICLNCPLIRCRGCRLLKAAKSNGKDDNSSANKTLKVTLRLKKSSANFFAVQQPQDLKPRPVKKSSVNSLAVWKPGQPKPKSAGKSLLIAL